MKRIIIYVVLILTAASLYITYLSYTPSQKEGIIKKEETAIQTDSEMPVLIWDKSCSYANTLSCADIVAPVLFKLNENGEFDELSDKKFTDSINCSVWGVFTNSFDPEITRAIMQDDEKRNILASRVSELCTKYDIEGANIDFENMYSDDSPLFTEFIRKLSEKLHEKNKILSVDVTKINRGSMFYSMCYDRAEISKYADFVILMGYDQYPRTSPVAGPVSGLDWIEAGVTDMLAEVPSEKLMLGIPFYTRLWEEENGTIVSSKAISMDESENLKADNAAVSTVDSCGLEYFDFERNGSKFRVWQENADSVQKRIDIAKKYNLSGIAGWCLGFENTEADSILSSI